MEVDLVLHNQHAMDDPESPEVSILFLGDADCGKSTFLSRIAQGLDGQRQNKPITLLRDGDQPFVYDIKFYNRPYRFELYDTASPKNWALLKPDVVVLCFDVSQRLSMINMKRYWIKETIKTFMQEREIPIAVLGLKRDLRSETDPNGIIYPQEAYRVAQEMRCDKYMECSAVTGELMKEAWEDICRTAALTTNKSDALQGLSEGGCVIM